MLKIKRFLTYHKCSFCGQELLSYDIEKINKDDYVCKNCKQCRGYTTRNTIYAGKQKQISFSFEFETCRRANELYELLKYNFIGCSDGSICGNEWKSPIFYSRKMFHNICRKINKFAKYVDSSCGTHLHVSTDYKEKIMQYEHEIFQPILDEMTSHKNDTIKFWGRYFTHYCKSEIGFDRYNAFNPRSSVETLEFRLLKFKNAEQYIRACDFCIDTTRYINSIIGREDFNTEMAKTVGKVIVNKYKEVITNVQSCSNE